MIEVAPLKFGAVFKLAFGQVDVFKQFIKDVLDIEINIDKVSLWQRKKSIQNRLMSFL